MKRSSSKNIAILYLINPVLSLFLIIRRYDLKQYHWILYFIAAFIGYTLSFEMEGADGFDHKRVFTQSVNWLWSDFIAQLGVIASRSTDTVDYYVTVANFVVSRFVSNPSFAFAFHAVVFAFFYLKVINLAYDEFNSNNWQKRLFLFGLVILFPITQLNALRYPIALWIWSFGALSYLKTNQIKYIGICLLASLVHFGITPATAIIAIYHFVGKRINLYFGIYLISFVLSNFISFEVLINLTEGMGEGIQGRAEGYMSDEYISRRSRGLNNVNWYVTMRYTLFNAYIILALLLLYFFRSKLITDNFQKILLAFSLLYAAYINMVIDIPSFGGRQRWFLWIIVLFSLYRMVSLNFEKAKWLSYMGLFPIALYGIVEIRTMFYYLSLDSILSNPVLVLIGKSGLSLNDILK